jgi:hypothetical protein
MVAALANTSGGLLEACPARLAELKDFALRRKSWRAVLLFSLRDPLCGTYLVSIGKMLATGEGLPLDGALGERIERELASQNAGKGATGELTQEEIDELLNRDTHRGPPFT